MPFYKRYESTYQCYGHAPRSTAFSALFAAFAIGAIAVTAFGQQAAGFRVGEKLSYAVSFEKFQNAALLETQVVSTGKLGNRSVIELRGRLKTFEIVSAAISLIDESRTVFVDPDSGMPQMIRRTVNSTAVPTEIVENFLDAPTTGNDLLSLIYKIRGTHGNGSFRLIENGEIHIVTVQGTKREVIRTDAGEFETLIVTIQSTFFDAFGVKTLIVNLSTDEHSLPVMIRFRTSKGNYRAELTGVQISEPAPTVEPTATPTPAPTPRPAETPKPQPTPTPYVPSLPLLPELAFPLGESLDYRVTNAGKAVAILRFEAKERNQFQNRDSLKLNAIVTGIEQDNSIFALGDTFTCQVDPETLVPFQSELRLTGFLKTLNQIAITDLRTGAIMFGGANSVDAPVGTHSLLSLIYAMRSFNLEPSKNPGSPVNDTRVAVFWNDRPYVFTLRPGNSEIITIGGEKMPAQLVVINTGNQQLDQLSMKVWLSNHAGRVPLRFSFGSYQADLMNNLRN